MLADYRLSFLASLIQKAKLTTSKERREKSEEFNLDTEVQILQVVTGTANGPVLST